ncbi:MAG: response regulator [Bacteroidota bacterium]
MIYILMVDDEPDMVSLFRQRFRREIRKGLVDLKTAKSGAEALSILAENRDLSPMVVLSDINMPGMDGLQLLKEIVARYEHPKVYMVSAYFGETDYEAKVKAAGAHGTFAKPIDFNSLKGQILNSG